MESEKQWNAQAALDGSFQKLKEGGSAASDKIKEGGSFASEKLKVVGSKLQVTRTRTRT